MLNIPWVYLYYFLVQKNYNEIKHHTIIFGQEYLILLEKFFKKYELPEDISIYLHRPTATDISFAPKGCDSFYALVPVPNLNSKTIFWEKMQITLRNIY